ncbi:MAG: cytochrome c3 family protein [Planctomycetota bacterium]
MKRWNLLLLRLLPFALLIGAVGCIAVQELAIYQERPIRFSHAIHMTQAKLACLDCHGDPKSADGIGMPIARKCTLCHNDKAAFESHLKPFLIDKKVVFTNVTDEGPDIKFSHAIHLAKNVSCESCHQGIDTSQAVSMDLKVGMQTCVACHEQNNVPASCETCHRTTRQNVPPPSHKLNWLVVHGPESKFHSQVTQNQCSLCHTEQTCNSCHQSQAPVSHTEFWKLRGHGISAEIDRESCATCHKSDSCDRCHQNTAPTTHTAAWLAPRDTHCLSCHEPLNRDNENCAVCHSGTPGHNSAPPKPSWHLASMNCRQCHGPGLSQPLPHVDNGDDCNECHH